ncbi:hypothetical protein NUU61_002170 [Penicillium alfredii]|uniref:Pentatricopeptide repeat protein n=1 Tax=Penicillium alfredii TaxID=1506179 RepID=A0A9W9FR74_9EURO|nr:uncharacterized protein NUU61_002170 [Penicillium alfredii]KAJ5104823.1 hypothetical protein NUU61_002170 [Penicillium alfredii]
MFAKAANTSMVPSRNALRVLRQLALTGSTVGGLCTVAVITYDVHRRIRVAEQIIENKRVLHTSAPKYDATSSAKRLAAMMEAAEAGEFTGLQSFKDKNNGSRAQTPQAGPEPEAPMDEELLKSLKCPPIPSFAGQGFSSAQEYTPDLTSEESPDDKTGAANDAALAREAEEAAAARAAGELPFEEKLRDMLQQGREIDAAYLFLKQIPHSHDCGISLERREIGCEVFKMNCIKGNIFAARTLFDRIAKVSFVTSEMWATMMHLLAKEGHIESVGNLFDRHCTKLIVPSYLLEVILRCLLESKRLISAKWLFWYRIQEDRDCGLCGAYLDGLWRKTRNLELINGEFRTILTGLVFLKRAPTEKLLNPMVKAYVEFGQPDAAEALVQDMPEKYKVQPGLRTVGLLSYGRALALDWDGVMADLRDMHARGFTQNKADFSVVFDRVFLEYWPIHKGTEIYDFLMGCIIQFDIVPDDVLYRHILEALIDRGTPDMVSNITNLAKEHKWPISLGDKELCNLIESRRKSMENAPIGFWRTLQAAKRQYGQAASFLRVLGSNAHSWATERQVLQPIHRPADDLYAHSLDNMATAKPIDMHIPLRRRMEHFLHVGKFHDALDVYQYAKKAGYVMRPIHLKLAVIATMLANGKTGLVDACIMVKADWYYGLQIPTLEDTPRWPRTFPLFFQQLLQTSPELASEATIFKMAIFEFYKTCTIEPGFKFKHFISIAVSRKLILNGKSHLAIRLLTAIYTSRWRHEYGFDQALLKIFMRAFAHVGNLRGVWWCMLTVLSRDEPVLRNFVVEAHLVMSILDDKLSRRSYLQHRRSDMGTLAELVKVLDKKLHQDPYWLGITTDLDFKRQMREELRSIAHDELDSVPSGLVRNMIVTFDEQMELDFLVNPHQATPISLHRWNEKSILGQPSIPADDPQYPQKRWVDVG